MAAKTETKAAPKTLLDVPEYAAAKQRDDELRRDLFQIHEQIDAIHADLAKARRHLDDKALALLDGTEGQEREETAHEKALRGSLDQMQDRRRLVERALRISEDRLRTLRQEASRQIVEPLVPGYRALVQEMADTILKLSRLADEESRFRDQLIAGDVQFTGSLRPMGVKGFGLRDPQSYANRWLNEAVEHHGVTVDAELKTPGVSPAFVHLREKYAAQAEGQGVFNAIRKAKKIAAEWV